MALSDLLPTNISLGTTSVAPGGSLPVSWTLLNQGAGAANSTSTTELRINQSSSSFAGTDLLGVSTSALGAGASVSQSGTLTAPTTPGTYYVWVIADDFSNVTNQSNTANDEAHSVAFTVTAPQSDLLPTNISLGTTSVAPGGSLPVSWTLLNQGAGAANSTSTTELRINQSSSSFAGTDLLGVSTSALGAGASVSQSGTLTAPTTPGTYYVWVIADDFSNVTNQSNTANDEAHSVAFTVTAPQSDLLPTNISLGTTSVAPGGSLSVSWTLLNQGAGAANSTSTTELRINQSSSSFAGTDLLGVSTSALGAGASVSQSGTLTAPTTPGTYYVWVIADDFSNVTNQSNTANDEAHSVAFTVTAPQSDLLPTNISLGTTSVAPGGSLPVSWTLLNQGAGAANSTSTTELRINQSSSSFAGTDLLGVSTSALGAGASVSQSGTLTAPTTPGTYYVWVIADDFSNVTNQSNTANDEAHSVAFTVTAPQSDLLPTNISLGTTSVAPGGSLPVSWTLLNQGAGAANSTSTTELRINQSSSSFAGTDLLGVSTSALGAGASVSQSGTLTAPTTPGTYYVWVIADDFSNVTNQSNTANDEAHSVAFTVTAPQSDLLPTNISLGTTSVAPGGSLPVSWTLLNQGAGAANSTSTTELRINQSSSSFAGTDLLGVSTSALGAGASVSQSGTLTAPTTPGTYYVWVIADDFSNVTNQSNTANDEAHSVAFTVTAPAPSLSSISPTSYPADSSNHSMQLFGSNFQSGDTLTFTPPEGGSIASNPAKLTFVSSSEIDYQFNDGSDVGSWSVQVNSPDNTLHSSLVSYSVASNGGIIDPYIPYNDSTPGDLTPSDVVAAAMQYGGSLWASDNCTGLVWAVSVDVGAPFYETISTATGGQSTSASQLTVVPDPANGFIVPPTTPEPGSSSAWQTLPATSNWQSIVQIGDVVRIPKGVLSGSPNGHSFIVVGQDSQGHWQVIDNTDPSHVAGSGNGPITISEHTFNSSNTLYSEILAASVAYVSRLVATAQPMPSLGSVSPTSYPVDSSNHLMQLFGSNFQSGDSLTFTPPEGGSIASNPAKLTFVSSSEIDYQFNDGSDVGSWSVRVNSPDKALHSSYASFSVTGGNPSSFAIVAGFDREFFPAHPDTMADLIQRTNLRWCGYYLDAPSQRLDTGWLGERGYLESLGWKIAPLYVGQQDPDPTYVAATNNRYSYQPSQSQGVIDGNEAVAEMGQNTGATQIVKDYDSATGKYDIPKSVPTGQGFAPGTVVFLDWENAPIAAGNNTDYIIAWCSTVAASNYKPGIYCRTSDIPVLAPLVAAYNVQFWAADWAGQPTVDPATTQFPTPDPSVESPSATSWQYGSGYTIQTANGPLSGVDLDLSSLFGSSSDDTAAEVVPASIVIVAGQTLAITGVQVVDDGSNGETFATVITAKAGTLSASGTGVSGSGSQSLSVTGTLSEVNAALNTLSYTSTGGSDTITVTTSDLVDKSSVIKNVGVTVKSFAVSIGGVAREGQLLTASSNAPVSSWQWQALTGGIWSTILGATDSTYLITEAVEGDRLRVVATADAGGAKATSAATAVVTDVQPTVSVSVTGVAQVGAVLTATPVVTTDADGGTLTLQWQSLVGTTWESIAGATNTTYLLGEADEGHKVQVLATFKDDTGQTASASRGPTAVVTDAAPQLSNPSALTVSAGGSVAMEVSVWSPDADDTVSVTIKGLTSYETITDGADSTIFMGTSVVLSAAEVNSGLTLHSTFSGVTHPKNTLTITASNATAGETVSSKSKSLTVTDPPAGGAFAQVAQLAQFMAATVPSGLAGLQSDPSHRPDGAPAFLLSPHH